MLSAGVMDQPLLVVERMVTGTFVSPLLVLIDTVRDGLFLAL